MIVIMHQKKVTSLKNKLRKCPKCGGNLTSFGGTEWKKNIGETKQFTIGRICKSCEIFYISPKFKDVKIIYHPVASTRELPDRVL